MLISHRKRFIYTKTVKTAGTSLESYFEKYCMPEGLWEFSRSREMYVGDSGIIGYRGNSPDRNEYFNHMSADSIRMRIGPEIWEKYFKFCVVRNPFDKLISAFHFLESPHKHEIDQNMHGNVIDRFRNWLASGKAEAIVDRDKYLIDGAVCVDHFIRYENIDAGLKFVCERLDIPFELSGLPRLKVGFRNCGVEIPDYYDLPSRNIVERTFEFELSYFGYHLSR